MRCTLTALLLAPALLTACIGNPDKRTRAERRDWEPKGTDVRLEDGRESKSPSAAGTAIMDGKACNGWKFWNLCNNQEQPTPSESEAEPDPEPKSSDQTTTKTRLIRKLPNQKGLPEGAVRFYCDNCKESFVSAAPDESLACPKGHSNPQESES